MKKLFFAALLATVAVGGAFAQYTTIPNSPTSQFNCSSNDTPTCASLGVAVYPINSSTPVGQDILDLEYQP